MNHRQMVAFVLKRVYGNLNVYICIMALNYVHFEIVSLQSADNESKWKMVISIFNNYDGKSY
jgi:hypothetical protein